MKIKREKNVGKIYGYCRISTPRQKIDRQVMNIQKAYPDAVIIREVYTGMKVKGRKEFEKLLKKAESGDTIVFDEVSRMSRNAEEGFRDYEELYKRGVELVFLQDPAINTAVYREAMKGRIDAAVHTGDADSDKLMQAILDALNEYMLALVKKQIQMSFRHAEAEVEEIHRRTSQGLAVAKLNGKRVGTRKGETFVTKKSVASKERIRELSRDFSGTLADADVIKLCGISRNTYYKYKRELAAE